MKQVNDIVEGKQKWSCVRKIYFFKSVAKEDPILLIQNDHI